MKRQAAKEAQILAIVKEPGKPAAVEPLFSNTLEAFQEAVGGYIETVTLASDLVIICNEEGRLIGLPFNVEVYGCDFVGPIVVVGVKGDSFCSLKAQRIPHVLRLLGGVEYA